MSVWLKDKIPRVSNRRIKCQDSRIEGQNAKRAELKDKMPRVPNWRTEYQECRIKGQNAKGAELKDKMLRVPIWRTNAKIAEVKDKCQDCRSEGHNTKSTGIEGRECRFRDKNKCQKCKIRDGEWCLSICYAPYAINVRQSKREINPRATCCSYWSAWYVSISFK